MSWVAAHPPTMALAWPGPLLNTSWATLAHPHCLQHTSMNSQTYRWEHNNCVGDPNHTGCAALSRCGVQCCQHVCSHLLWGLRHNRRVLTAIPLPLLRCCAAMCTRRVLVVWPTCMCRHSWRRQQVSQQQAPWQQQHTTILPPRSHSTASQHATCASNAHALKLCLVSWQHMHVRLRAVCRPCTSDAIPPQCAVTV